MVSENFSMGIAFYVFNYMECITGANMALHIDDQHILYYHMDAYMSRMLEHGCCQSPNYLAIQGWIRSTLL